MDARIEIRRFERPDDERDFAAHGRIAIVRLRDGTAGMHAVLEPGWTWASDDTGSWPRGHTGYCIAGEMVVRTARSGPETRIRAGDFFQIEHADDAYVPGDRRCELLLFAAPLHPAAADPDAT